MGRFYKTSAQTPVDYMYELPKELMMKAVQSADTDITKTEEGVAALNDNLKLQYLNADSEAAKAKLAEYKNQINDFSKQIQADPMAFRRQTSGIRDLSRTIQDDFATGEASKIQGNYNTRQANLKTLEEMWTKNPDKYNYEDIGKLMSINDAGYTGFKAGGYNQGMLKEYQDINDYEKLAKDYEPEILKQHNAYKGADGYLYSSINANERVDPNLIKNDLLKAMMGDEKLGNYYRQQIQLGNTTAEEVAAKMENTINRLGGKYGYDNTERGITSMKNDDQETAAFVKSLENPQGNMTPGSVFNESIVDTYKPKDANGVAIPSNSVAGVTATIGMIDKGKQTVTNGVIDLAKNAGIILNPEQQKALLNGDYSVLAGKKDLDASFILSAQAKYSKLQRDQDILNRKIEQANATGDPAKFLATNKGGGISSTIGTFQELGIVKKGQEKEFKTAYTDWKNGFENSPNVMHAKLKFDANQLASMKQPVAYKDAKGVVHHDLLKNVLKDGMTYMDMYNMGLLEQKKTKVGDKAETKKVTKIVGGDNSWIPNFIEKRVWGEETKNVPTGVVTPIYQNNNEFTNFKINSKNLVPTLNLDSDGNAMAQFGTVLNGQEINTYMNEKDFSNTRITKTLDMDRMNAANFINEADSEGVITDKAFNIEGVDFKRSAEGIIANDNYSTAQAIEAIANKLKQDREAIQSK
jgi:hypothetical protein